jgi:hypothetical protein
MSRRLLLLDLCIGLPLVIATLLTFVPLAQIAGWLS